VYKILLTGSSGFIGSELLNELSKKYKIYVTIRKKRKNLNQNQNINEIFFKNYEQLNRKLKNVRVDVVIHCATHYVKYHNEKDIKKLAESNILFGNLILENLKKMKVKKFINFTTVWENYNGKKDNFYNLYSVYKKNFSNIMKYYKKIHHGIKFYNLIISDTFGDNDKRKKLINTLKTNYKKNKLTSIVSKRLSMNLLNVKDISNAIKIILKKKINSNDYVLKNNQDFSILEIVDRINKISVKKIKIKWQSSKLLKEKIYKYKKIKNWKPNKSKIHDIVDLIIK
jgi:nucleoside-diphosphate-sugar epimerase